MKPLTLAPALLLAACSAAGPERAPGTSRPTIVSLNPCTDAILAEVTAPGQLLAISHYSKDPGSSSMEAATAARYRATGGTVEEVVVLDPDIVVASTFIAPATRAALEDFGIRVETFGSASTVEGSVAQVHALAALSHGERQGEVLASKMAAAVEGVRDGDDLIEAALWQPGGIVPGEQALVADLLRRTGFALYSGRLGMQQADYLALEQVVADPPDVLLVAGNEAAQKHPVLDSLPGMRRESFDTDLLYCGGPTIIRAAARLGEIRAHSSRSGQGQNARRAAS